MWTNEPHLALGEGAKVITDPDVLLAHARDQAPLAPAGMPLAMVRARHADDVAATLRFANARQIPVVTRAAGTGLAGGANALDGCIVLSVAAMNQLLRLDEAARLAVVQPGVLNADLARAAAARGLFYAPDPASREISTIGGNIATNAGGSCCLKYGVTGDHVAALEVVLADGSRLRTGALTRKNVAGYDLTRLLVGSEGTLAVVVEATVRLLRAPRPACTLVAFFSTLERAGDAVVELDGGLDLSLLEVMDQTTIRAVEAHAPMELDVDAGAFLLLQSDAPDAAATVERAEAICQRLAARSVLRTDDPDEGRQLLTARRLALPALEKLGLTLLDDVAVPRQAMPEMFRRIDAIAAKHQFTIGTFGHAGDGNLHPTIVFAHRDEAARARAMRAFDAIIEAALALGGSVSGEHGIGSLKPAYLESMLGQTQRALQRRVKAAFDPNGILNPGRAI